jgi:hypothetical protein
VKCRLVRSNFLKTLFNLGWNSKLGKINSYIRQEVSRSLAGDPVLQFLV